MKNKYIKFWGTRGSCPVSGPEYAQFGGNTPCVELRYDETVLIFEAGTGIRPLGKKLKAKTFDLFLSHFHWDHLVGFPFFDPIFDPSVTFTIWAPEKNGRPCKELFEAMFAPEFFPLKLSDLKARISFKTYRKPIQVGPLKVEFFPANHPGGAFLYKVTTPEQIIGFGSDNELVAPYTDLVQFYEGCDIMIHEAQYSPEQYPKKRGWGHSNLIEVIEFVKQTGAKRWLVSHHDPVNTDTDLIKLAEMAAKECPVPSAWVRDGDVVELV